MLNSFLGTKKISGPILLYIILSTILYLLFAYGVERQNFIHVLAIYSGLFVLFYKIINDKQIEHNVLLKVSFGLRLLFLFSIPNLSQDFYRFIWDGRMLLEGINPYLHTPISFVQDGIFPIDQAQQLYDGMGSLSANHFTNYPPLNQLCFGIAALFASKSIMGSAIVLRLIIIFSDYGIYHYGKKLLTKLDLPQSHIFWYLLNPFIIIELSGNLHFEGVMIFFLIWSLYLLSIGNFKTSAILLACSISIKLIPLMLIPLYYKHLGFKRLISFGMIVAGVSILLFSPFISTTFLNNYSETVGLWFQNFEFNASLYYVAREIGYTFRGYNEIAIIGKIIPVLVVLFIAGLSLFRKNTPIQHLISAMLLALTFYFATATTVHPWYIATLLALSLFTTYKYPIVWSYLIILSYASYSNTIYQENLYFVALEYLILYGVIIYEVINQKKLSKKDINKVQNLNS